MRYYDVPDRPVVDPETGSERPTRVKYFDGGRTTTRFVDPETGIGYDAVFVGQWIDGTPVEFRRPMAPSRATRLRIGRELGVGTSWVPAK